MKLLQKNLLEKFAMIRDNVVNTTDVQLKREQMLNAAVEVCSKYDGVIALNYQEVMEHQLSSFEYNIDSVINYLAKSIQDPFDLETAQRESDEGFDQKYGSQTSKVFEQIELPDIVSEARIKYAARFHPSPVTMIQKALDDLINFEIQYSDWIFIDIGSGLGRNLLIASQYSFKRVIGVEISSYLCKQALENIEKFNAVESLKCNAEVLCTDVMEYQLPDDNSILYFWEPFMEEVADKFIKKLEEYASNTSNSIILVFLGRVYPAIANSKFFTQVGRHVNSTEKTIGLGITYFQNVETLVI